MKNMKKILALVISALLVLSMVAAFADSTNTSVTTPANKNDGSFTITMQSAEAGHTFKAYRIFDGSVSTSGKLGDIAWAAGVNTEGIASALTTAGLATTVGEAPNQKTLDLSKATDVAEALALQSDDNAVMIAVADVFYARKGSAVATVSTKTGDNYVLGSGEAGSTNAPLVAGYYLVTDEYTNPSNVAEGAETLSRNVLAVVGNVTAVVKNDKPEIEKKILDPSAVDYNEAGVGETVVYQLTTEVPNHTGYKEYYFVINDTLSNGLTFNPSSVVVTVDGTAQTPDTDYVLYTGDDAGEYTFQIAFKNIMSKTIAAPIVVTYNAVVNGNAVTTAAGNPNEVDLIYSNNPNHDGNGSPEDNPKPDDDYPVGKTPKDKVITYVAKLELTKYFDSIAEDHKLAGATFLLTGTSSVPEATNVEKYVADANGTYYKLADGSYTTTEPHDAITKSDGTVIASNRDAYDQTDLAAGTKYKITTEVTYKYTDTKEIFTTGTGASGADGLITFAGLGAGTYTLTEIVTPQGYTTAAPITFTIGATMTGDPALDTAAVTWTTNNEAVTVNASTGVYATDVVDLSGSTLPSTGGMGTTILYVGGSILVLAAVILLITKRRMNAED
jgi:fimbrial isopeptide formation D2 family protein/LPXTG-motif cell wall-anchored protein